MISTDQTCGKSWGGLRAEHCKVCHETFSGTTAGDKHRTGDFGADRRCRTADEMTDLGMVQKPNGTWGMGGTWTGPAA